MARIAALLLFFMPPRILTQIIVTFSRMFKFMTRNITVIWCAINFLLSKRLDAHSLIPASCETEQHQVGAKTMAYIVNYPVSISSMQYSEVILITKYTF